MKGDENGTQERTYTAFLENCARLCCRYIMSFFGFIIKVLMIRLMFIHIYQRGFTGIEVIHGLYSLSGKTSYRQISWSLEAARLDVAMVVSLWNLTGTSAASLPRYLPNFTAIGKVKTRNSRLRDFTRSCGKTSYSLVNRGHVRSYCYDSQVYFADKGQNDQYPITKKGQISQGVLYFLVLW